MLAKRRWLAKNAQLHGLLPGSSTRMASARIGESAANMVSDPAGHSQFAIEPMLPNQDGFSDMAVRSEASLAKVVASFSKAMLAKRCVTGCCACPYMAGTDDEKVLSSGSINGW